MERRAAAATSATTLALNDADPKGEWTLEASVRAIDACRAAVVETGERDGGGYIMYVKLTMTGSRGTIAVGDSYAVVPSAGGAKERRNGQKHKTCLQMEEAATLLLTGSSSFTFAGQNRRQQHPPTVDWRVLRRARKRKCHEKQTSDSTHTRFGHQT